MTGNLPERDYARSKRVCNDGFQDVARTNGALDDGCSTQCDSWRCTAKIGRPIRIMTGIAPDAPIASNSRRLKWQWCALIKRETTRIRTWPSTDCRPYLSNHSCPRLEFDRCVWKLCRFCNYGMNGIERSEADELRLQRVVWSSLQG